MLSIELKSKIMIFTILSIITKTKKLSGNVYFLGWDYIIFYIFMLKNLSLS